MDRQVDVAATASDVAPIVNIAAYKFVALAELPDRQTQLRAWASEGQLLGSILLSPEGINLFLAGAESAIRIFLSRLREDPAFADMPVKESRSERQPFGRLRVRLKREIIAFGVPTVVPERATAPRISPTELKAWLDAGRRVTLLDTRNTYEVEQGTFRGAVTLPLRHFRRFPEAVAQLPEALKDQTIVTFCTGGIRCEKAAAYMQQQGFSQVLQLDGGILRYFEECGGDHWVGHCFVFDERVCLDPALAPAELAPAEPQSR